MESKGKRTGIDFSKHTHRVEIFKCDKKEIRIDHFQQGNSRMNYIQFINTDEIMSVTGDFGNWIFCRPFIPKKNDYWFKNLYKDNKLFPKYYLQYSFFAYPAHMDVINDDQKLLNTYCKIQWLKYIKDNNLEYWDKGKNDFELKIIKDSEKGEGDFPVAMIERIRLIYGDKATELYEQLLTI